ncbi:MAG: MoxR family ATPase [Lacipirellulaceae bacterium]
MRSATASDNHQPVLAEDATNEDVAQLVDELHSTYQEMRAELAGVIVGMEDVIEQLMIGILCRGHCILQGMPGLAKTLLISQMAQIMELSFNRVQFTPDLMPADITGGEVLEEDRTTGGRAFRFVQGPLFANLVLADEINRTPPKTQSALLEAMEERQLSVAGKTYDLPEPFFVLATQNPIEVEGTYPLPEAQLDRFLLKIKVGYPDREAEREICRRQTTSYAFKAKQVINASKLLQMQALTPKVLVADHVYDAAIDLARLTRPSEGMLPAELRDKVQYGAGPRASMALLMAGKARALLNKRCHVTTTDIFAVAAPVLRHRIIPTFNAEAAGLDTDDIVTALVKQQAANVKAAQS